MWYLLGLILMIVLIVSNEIVLSHLLTIILMFAVISLRKRLRKLEEVLRLSEDKQSEDKVLKEVEKITIAEKSAFYLFYKKAYTWLTQGNSFVHFGIIILFIGFSLLFKEAYSSAFMSLYFPLKVRLLAVLVFAFILLYFGFKMRKDKNAYGLLLIGASLGIFYLILYASLHFYALFSPLGGFVLFVLLSAISIGLSLYLSSQSLAIFAIMGGFFSPLLSINSHENMLVLLGFYAILNTAIFFISLFKSWRQLNLLGFFFSFVISAIWTLNETYTSQYFIAIEGFLLYFFLLYLAISIYFAKAQSFSLTHYLDSILVFALPMMVFSIQVALLWNQASAIALSALFLSVFYLLLAYGLAQRFKQQLTQLREAFIALSLLFLTLSIPFALNQTLNALIWILQGTGILWLGLQQAKKYQRYFGMFLQVFGSILLLDLLFSKALITASFILFLSLNFSAYLLFIHKNKCAKLEQYIGTFYLFYAGGFLFMSFARYAPEFLLPLSFLAFVFYSLLVVYTPFSKAKAMVFLSLVLFLFLLGEKSLALLLFVSSLLSLIFAYLSLYRPWHKLAHFSMLFLPVIFVIALAEPWFAQYESLLYWGFALASFVLLSYHWQKLPLQTPYLSKAINLGALTFIFMLSSHLYQLRVFLDYDLLFLASLPLSALLFSLFIFRSKIWFFLHYRDILQQYTSKYIALGLMIWSFYTALAYPQNTLIPWFPLLNPLELVQILVLIASYFISKTFSQKKQILLSNALAVWVFIWVNIVILRSIAYYGNIAWDMGLLAHSNIQISLSISWVILGLSFIIIASKNAKRGLWLLGSSILALVIFKLFLIDLQNQNTLFSTLLFILVGVLLLLVGYISPLPPQKEEAKEID